MWVWNTALACGSALWIGAWMQKQERSTSPSPLFTSLSSMPTSMKVEAVTSDQWVPNGIW